jgi:hypothetical protein
MVDFVTHLAYLACAFVGAHESVQCVWRRHDPASPLAADELRALVDAERGTAILSVSSNSQPDVFSLRVHGTRMRASASLFEPLLTIERQREIAQPLVPVWNGLSASWAHSRSAFGGLWRKLSGRPLTYEGLWTLLGRFYRSLAQGEPPPISIDEIERSSRLVWDVLAQEPRA